MNVMSEELPRPPGGARQLGTVSAVDALAADISERIVSGDFAPGARLPESSIARSYDVSRHTLRAALTRLTAAGLITYQTNRGWFVSELSAEEFADITFLRVALEVQAMRELARRGERVGPEARAALKEMLDTEEGTPMVDRLRIDMRLHQALVDQAGSRRLSTVYRDVQLSLRLYFVTRLEWFQLHSRAEFEDIHTRLCQAIDSGDPSRVERHLRDQLDYHPALVSKRST